MINPWRILRPIVRILHPVYIFVMVANMLAVALVLHNPLWALNVAVYMFVGAQLYSYIKLPEHYVHGSHWDPEWVKLRNIADYLDRDDDLHHQYVRGVQRDLRDWADRLEKEASGHIASLSRLERTIHGPH